VTFLGAFFGAYITNYELEYLYQKVTIYLSIEIYDIANLSDRRKNSFLRFLKDIFCHVLK